MIALPIVHGIGEQRRGQTTEKSLVGLKAAYGDAMHIEHDADDYPVAVTANGQTVRLYEVYWADVLSAEKSRGTFTWHIPNTLVWHPAWCRQSGMLPSPEYSEVRGLLRASRHSPHRRKRAPAVPRGLRAVSRIPERAYGSALPRVGRTTAHAVRAPEGRCTVLGENLLGPLTAIVAVVFGLMAVAAVVLIPAYLVAWPFRWFGAETLGVRVQNGMALFTLFGRTTGMLLHMRDRRNEAKQTCESAHRSSG